MPREFFSKKWIKANSEPSLKVEEFKNGDLETIIGDGWFYRIDEPSRKGEWFGPYKTEDEARGEGRAEMRDDAREKNDSDDWDDD